MFVCVCVFVHRFYGETHTLKKKRYHELFYGFQWTKYKTDCVSGKYQLMWMWMCVCVHWEKASICFLEYWRECSYNTSTPGMIFIGKNSNIWAPFNNNNKKEQFLLSSDQYKHRYDNVVFVANRYTIKFGSGFIQMDITIRLDLHHSVKTCPILFSYKLPLIITPM